MAYIDLKVGDLDPTGAGKIDTIVIQGDGFIVYLEEDYGISWSTEEHYTGFAEDFGDVSNRVLILEGITNNLYKGKELRNINYILAQGLARVLDDKNSVTANKVLVEFEKSLEEKGRQLLKIEFIVASFVATVIVIIILCLLWMARYGLAFMLGDNAFQLVIASFCGGIGAFVSSFIRSLNFTGDIRVAKSTYRFDGAMRIFFGIIAGFITALAIQSNMLLGIINDLQGSSTSLICFLSTVAGASESLVPSIVKKVEEKV
jgi:hypothetical protein